MVGQFVSDGVAAPKPDPLDAEHQDRADHDAQLAENALADAGYRQAVANGCACHGHQDVATAWETSAEQSEQIAGNHTAAALTEYAADPTPRRAGHAYARWPALLPRRFWQRGFDPIGAVRVDRQPGERGPRWR